MQPPDWIAGWYQLLVIQIAGVLAAGVGIWKWLTKPLRKETEDLKGDLEKHKKGYRRLRKQVAKDSFEWRTWVGTATRSHMETEHRLDILEAKLAGLQTSADRVEKLLTDGFGDVRNRLTSLETEFRVRVEHNQRRETDDKR